jgi:hypothetical protein
MLDPVEDGLDDGTLILKSLRLNLASWWTGITPSFECCLEMRGFGGAINWQLNQRCQFNWLRVTPAAAAATARLAVLVGGWKPASARPQVEWG